MHLVKLNVARIVISSQDSNLRGAFLCWWVTLNFSNETAPRSIVCDCCAKDAVFSHSLLCHFASTSSPYTGKVGNRKSPDKCRSRDLSKILFHVVNWVTLFKHEQKKSLKMHHEGIKKRSVNSNCQISDCVDRLQDMFLTAGEIWFLKHVHSLWQPCFWVPWHFWSCSLFLFGTNQEYMFTCVAMLWLRYYIYRCVASVCKVQAPIECVSFSHFKESQSLQCWRTTGPLFLVETAFSQKFHKIAFKASNVHFTCESQIIGFAQQSVHWENVSIN